jgi:electron transfer flavoprotein alpha subunit
MTVLLLAEHDNVALSEMTARALTAASQMGEAVDILVAGRGAKASRRRRRGCPVCAASCWPTHSPSSIGWPNRPPR